MCKLQCSRILGWSFDTVNFYNGSHIVIIRKYLSFLAIDMLSSYLQCTPAPPTAYDLHPKPCNNTLDCFPNVCCMEQGKKYCRPPKKSLLSLLTTFAQVWHRNGIEISNDYNLIEPNFSASIPALFDSGLITLSSIDRLTETNNKMYIFPPTSSQTQE